MLFNSYAFMLGFLPLALAGCVVAGRFSVPAMKLWLIAASLIFYGCWNPVFVPLLLTSVLVNLAAARAIQSTEIPAWRNRVAIAAIIANLAALIWYRYLVAWLAALDAWFDTGLSMDDPLVPLGLSFFTFTQIGYLLDCRAGTEERRSTIDYILFAVFSRA